MDLDYPLNDVELRVCEGTNFIIRMPLGYKPTELVDFSHVFRNQVLIT